MCMPLMPVSIVFVDMCINDVCVHCVSACVYCCSLLFLSVWFKHLSVKTKMAVYNACFISTLMYGSDI